MSIHLVLSGSGARFASFIGAYSAILEKYPDFHSSLKSIIATSGGALVGTMICLDYSVRAIQDLCNNLEYNDLKQLDINQFFVNYGIESGNSITRLFKAIIQKKLGDGNATFNDFYRHTGRSLIITGTNLTTMQLVDFSYKSHPNMEVWRALRITISIPFLFTSTLFEGHHYADGGVLCQFPIKFLPDLNRRDRVLGINLEFRHESNHITDIISYIKALTKTIFKSVNYVDFDDLAKKYTIIRVMTDNLSAFDLDVSISVRKSLIDSALQQSRLHLNTQQEVVRRLIHTIFQKVECRLN